MAAGVAPAQRRVGRLGRYWFLWALVAVGAVTLLDPTGTIPAWGLRLASWHIPDLVIFLIFLLSGIPLSLEQVRKGSADLGVIFLSLLAIHVATPVLGWALGTLPLAPGVRIGLFLVAAMPTTLSTGVVMAAASGGNPASALLTTLASNTLAIFTVPLTLALLLGATMPQLSTGIESGTLLVRIALLVGLPLAIGLLLGPRVRRRFGASSRNLGRVNLGFVLGMVWMALSKSGPALAGDLGLLGLAAILSVAFHALAWAVVAALALLFRVGRGRRETLVFMGGQKTLTLAILLQTSLFSGYGEALLVCVVHHVVHLLMDGYLVGRLAAERAAR